LGRGAGHHHGTRTGPLVSDAIGPSHRDRWGTTDRSAKNGREHRAARDSCVRLSFSPMPTLTLEG